MPRPRRVSALLLGFVCSLSAPAFATTAADLCAPAANPCVVSGTVNVTNGSVLDFGARTFELQGTLQVGTYPSGDAGLLSILAGNVTIRNSGKIFSKSSTAAGGEVDISTSGLLDIQTGGGASGTIDVSGTQGGTILLIAGGPMTLTGPLLADSTAIDGDGGAISATASAITLGTKGASVIGGMNAGGGTIEFTATTGSIVTNGPLSASGGSFVSGGDVILTAAADVTCNQTIDVNSNGGLDGGSGGTVTITANNNVALNGTVNGRGSAGDDGGDVKLYATTGSIKLTAPINVTGGTGGYGGSLDASAGTTFSQDVVDAVVDVSAPGTDGSGGAVGIVAPGGAALRNIDATSGSAGGDITVSTDGLLSATGTIEADGTALLTAGGTVTLASTASLVVSGKVHASGPITQSGGVVTLSGCSVSVTSVGQVSALGLLGRNQLRAATQMTVAGKLTAGGSNLLTYRSAGTPPSVTGMVLPAATITLDPTLAPCGPPPPTTSTTTTTSTSITTTSTSTTTVTTTSTTSTSIPTTSTTTSVTTSSSTTVSTSTTTTTSTTTAPSTTSTTGSSSTTTASTSTTTTTATSTTTTSSSTTSSSTSTTSTAASTTQTTTTGSSTTTTSTTPSSTTTASTAPSTSSTTATTSTATTTSTTTTTAQPECTATDATACDDADRCTVDTCSDGTCTHLPLAGYPAVDCRLLTITDEISIASGKTIPSRTLATRLTAQIEKARTFVDSAQNVEGSRRTRRLRRAGRLVSRWAQTVERARVRGKMDATVALEIRQLSLDAVERLSPLTPEGK